MCLLILVGWGNKLIFFGLRVSFPPFYPLIWWSSALPLFTFLNFCLLEHWEVFFTRDRSLSLRFDAWLVEVQSFWSWVTLSTLSLDHYVLRFVVAQRFRVISYDSTRCRLRMLLLDRFSFRLARTMVLYIFLIPRLSLDVVLVSLSTIIIRTVAVLSKQKLISLLILLNLPERRVYFLKNS